MIIKQALIEDKGHRYYTYDRVTQLYIMGNSLMITGVPLNTKLEGVQQTSDGLIVDKYFLHELKEMRVLF